MIWEIFPFATFKLLSIDNSLYVTARLQIKNPHISNICFLCGFLITFIIQFQGLVRDHKQQYSLNLDSLAFKWKQPLGQQNTPTPPKHIREKHLLVIRLQGRKVDPLIEDKENYT